MKRGSNTVRLPRCGVWMPTVKEPCARAAGHSWEHRTRYAMDNAYRATMGRDPEPFVERQGEWVPR